MASEARQRCTPTESLPILGDDEFLAGRGSVGVKLDREIADMKIAGVTCTWLYLNGSNGTGGFWATADELRGIATMLADFADELDGLHAGATARMLSIGDGIPAWLKS